MEELSLSLETTLQRSRRQALAANVLRQHGVEISLDDDRTTIEIAESMKLIKPEEV